MNLTFKLILLSGAILGACIQSSNAGLEEFDDNGKITARINETKEAWVLFENNTKNPIKINFKCLVPGEKEERVVTDADIGSLNQLLYIIDGVPDSTKISLTSIYEHTTGTNYQHNPDDKVLDRVWFSTWENTRWLDESKGGILTLKLNTPKS